MGKGITKACGIILLPYLLFFNANTEQKTLILSHQRHACRQKQSKNRQNLLCITTTALLHTDWYCQKTFKQTLDRPIVITSKPNQNQTAYHSLPVNKRVRINSKKFMCIHCKCLLHLQCSTLKAILIIKDSCKAHEWVCESCHLKELFFSGLREFQEITATSPKTINTIDILNFKSHRKHLIVGNLNTQSMVSLFDEFHVMLQKHPFHTLTLSET